MTTDVQILLPGEQRVVAPPMYFLLYYNWEYVISNKNWQNQWILETIILMSKNTDGHSVNLN